MALIKWYEVATTGDCLDSNTTWNNMVDYIKHSACTDFTIYETCPNTGQAFRFTKSGTISSMLGGDDAGDDLQIYANDIDTQPRICLFGNSDIWLDTQDEVKFKQNNSEFLNFDKAGTYDIIEGKTAGNDLKIVGVEGIHNYFKAGEEFKLFDGATEALRITYAATLTTMRGGANVGDDFKISANTVDARSSLVFFGGGGLLFDVTAGNGTSFADGGTAFGYFLKAGNDFRIAASIVNGNVDLLPNGTGKVKFGTYAAKGAEAFDGFIPILDTGGNPRKLMTCA